MASSSEYRNIDMLGVSKEIREGVAAALDALSNWKDEIDTANERCLKKVLDKNEEVARAMGWPDQAINATRDHLERVASMQTDVIAQFIDTWKRQLKSQSAPTAVPRAFSDLMPGLTGPTISGMPAFTPFAPWAFWFQAAEMWQRTLMPEPGPRERERSRH